MKITVSHGKKVPIPGVDYSSQDYFVSIEDEVEGLSGPQIDGHVKSLWARCQRLVSEAVGQAAQQQPQTPAEPSGAYPAAAMAPRSPATQQRPSTGSSQAPRQPSPAERQAQKDGQPPAPRFNPEEWNNRVHARLAEKWGPHVAAKTVEKATKMLGYMVSCPDCNAGMWDNRPKNQERVLEGKKPMPDFKCKGIVKFSKPRRKGDRPEMETLQEACEGIWWTVEDWRTQAEPFVGVQPEDPIVPDNNGNEEWETASPEEEAALQAAQDDDDIPF